VLSARARQIGFFQVGVVGKEGEECPSMMKPLSKGGAIVSRDRHEGLLQHGIPVIESIYYTAQLVHPYAVALLVLLSGQPRWEVCMQKVPR